MMRIGIRICFAAVLAVVGAFLLGGCSGVEEDDVMARQWIDAIRAGDYEAATKMIDPEYRNAQTAQALPTMRGLLDQGELKEMRRIGYTVRGSMGSGPSFRDCSYELEFSKAWVLANFRIYHNGAKRSLQSVHLNPLNRSLESANQFTLVGKSMVQFAFLFMVIVEPLFMLATLMVCIRTRMKHKGLWCLLVLVGVWQVRMNWSTGGMDWRPAYIGLLGSSAFKMGIGAPWVLSFSLPAGAIVFLLKRRSLSLPKPIGPPPVPSPPPPAE